jgi:hypothetical protein
LLSAALNVRENEHKREIITKTTLIKIPKVVLIVGQVLLSGFALDSQETVTWVFVDFHTSWQFLNSLRTLVLAEVENGLLFAATKYDSL